MQSQLGWRGFTLALALAYWAANAALHLAFSNWVTSAQPTPFGPRVPVHYTREIAWLCSGLLLAWLAWQYSRHRVAWRTGLAWLVLFAAIVASNRWLLTTYVETIHYLQYALITLLFAWSLDPRRERWPLLEIWLIVFWLSVLDEAYQYLSLTARQGTYFDFNDLLLNQLGVLVGLLLYYGFQKAPASAEGMPALRRVLLGATVAVVLAGWIAGVAGWLVLHPGRQIPPGGFHPDDAGFRLYLQREPRLFGHWQRTFSDGYYFVLSPWQGAGLLLFTALPCLRWRRLALAFQ